MIGRQRRPRNSSTASPFGREGVADRTRSGGRQRGCRPWRFAADARRHRAQAKESEQREEHGQSRQHGRTALRIPAAATRAPLARAAPPEANESSRTSAATVVTSRHRSGRRRIPRPRRRGTGACSRSKTAARNDARPPSRYWSARRGAAGSTGSGPHTPRRPAPARDRRG